MENLDYCLIGLDYKNPDNIAYLATMLEATWGVDRITTLMKAARIILDNQEKEGQCVAS